MRRAPRPLSHPLPRLLLLTGALLALAGGLPGCNMYNPSYFPYLLPPGEVVQTHAKPPGKGYYANFDPYACRLEVRPVEASNAVGTQHVLIATVYDNSGQARRGRRVEWMVEGPGSIVEVDESGHLNGRGYKVDNHYAVSYTDYFEHTITRGNNDPNDDFTVRPGQSWCVITSPVEGDTHVTVYCPEIYNWDKHKVHVTMHWINAGWTMPPPAVNRVGSQHALTTNVFRFTDRMPVANYRVRYTVLDGPPAVFLPGQQRTAEAITDLQGNATVTLAQAQPAAGVNRIGIEIIRPPDPCCPTGPGIIIGRGETTKEWVAPQIAVNKQGPPAVAVGQVFNYTITVANTGRLEADGITVRDAVPEGLTYVSSQPPAIREGRDLIWTLGVLPPGGSQVLTVAFQADRVGSYTNAVVATTPEGLRADSAATTQVAAPGLAAAITGPQTGTVNNPIEYRISVTNTGNGPATNVVLTAQFDAGLVHESGANPVQLEIGTLTGGQTRETSLVLTPRQAGQLKTTVTATGDGNLVSTAQHVVTVTQPRITLNKTGPAFKYVRGQVEWTLTVVNPNDAPLTNVVLRDQLPPEVSFLQASGGGLLQANNLVVWNLGTLQAGEERRVQVTARAETVAPRAVNVATATADGGLSQRAEMPVELRGAAGLRLEAFDTQDPVAVGDQTEYEVSVTNQGSVAANGIAITATVPPEFEVLSAVGPNNQQPQVTGRRVVFTAADGLLPNQNWVYRITVRALTPGDARFRVELRSGLSTEPVVEEESTTVFRPIAPGGAAPPRPPALP
jgi:uncharacterized repeat protein (TIGR01451 family)